MPERKSWMNDPRWDGDSFPLSYDDDPNNPIGCYVDDGLEDEWREARNKKHYE